MKTRQLTPKALARMPQLKSYWPIIFTTVGQRTDANNRGRLWQRVCILFLGLVFFAMIYRIATVWFDSQYFGVREPYLQRPSTTAVSILWQAKEASIGMLRFRAKAPAGQEWHWLSEKRSQRFHALRIEQLQPGQEYEYEVWQSEARVYGPYTFRTWPDPVKPLDQSLRFWVLGDPGLNSQLARQVRASAATWLEAHPHPGPSLDLLFTTGDNAYSSGRNLEYQLALFDPLATVLAQVPMFPIYGNHDARRWAFYRIFDLPGQGESGGLPSGCEAYYALDYGPVHWVVLDSQDRAGSADGAMARWLAADLAATQAKWRIALFHHPPYSHGSHTSDHGRGSDWRLRAMRENFLPILEAGGVDLVISGHSHAYERSALLHGHYGPSEGFDRSRHVVDAGSELAEGWQYHQQAGQQTGADKGTMYVVLGNSAEVHGGGMDHPALPIALMEGGSLMVEVKQDCLRGSMLAADGHLADVFNLLKPDATCAL